MGIDKRNLLGFFAIKYLIWWTINYCEYFYLILIWNNLFSNYSNWKIESILERFFFFLCIFDTYCFTPDISPFSSPLAAQRLLSAKLLSSLLIHRLGEKGNLLTQEWGKLACRTSFMRSESFSLTFDWLKKLMFVWITDINNSVILLS